MTVEDAAMHMRSTETLPARSTLGSVNVLFHEAYAELVREHRTAIARGEVNVIIRMDDRLRICRGREYVDHEVNGRAYHQYKAACHMALLAYLVANRSSPEDSALPSLLDAVGPGAGDDVYRVARQCRRFIDALPAGEPSHRQVTAFAKQLEAPIARLIDRAARDEVQGIMTVLEEFDAQPEVDWANTFLVVCGGNQPRYKHLCKVLFKHWVDSREDHVMRPEYHVLYAEGAGSYDEVADLLARHLAGATLGDVFLGGPLSMNEDLLGDAAQRAMEAYFTRPVRSPPH